MWAIRPGFFAICLMVQASAVYGEGFQRALPGYAFQFPRDHGSHPAFRTEWWYYTGNVETREGRPFGFELTFFRQRLLPVNNSLRAASPLAADELLLAHFAISDIQREHHKSFERIGREGFAQGHASTATLEVVMGDWQARLVHDARSSQTMRIAAAAEDTALSLTLRPGKPFVIHGENGVHQKAEDAGQASHYISFTRLETSGTLRVGGEQFHVTGLSWMDHEFGSDQLGPNDEGWDWFALQLDSGEDLMLYQIRRKGGTVSPFNRGTLVEISGAKRTIPGTDYTIRATGTWQSTASGARYPMGWEIELPGEQGKLTIEPCFTAQEMLTRRSTGMVYWEGAVRIRGSWRGRAVAGAGYVELVGYAGKMMGL